MTYAFGAKSAMIMLLAYDGTKKYNFKWSAVRWAL